MFGWRDVQIRSVLLLLLLTRRHYLLYSNRILYIVKLPVTWICVGLHISIRFEDLHVFQNRQTAKQSKLQCPGLVCDRCCSDRFRICNRFVHYSLNDTFQIDIHVNYLKRKHTDDSHARIYNNKRRPTNWPPSKIHRVLLRFENTPVKLSIRNI